MMGSMQSKVVIVTGASLGIGKATSLMLAEAGAHVVMIARNAEKLRLLQEQIEAKGGSVESHALDVGEAEALDAQITEIAQRHGRLDGLVNNASSYTYGQIVDASNDEWREAFRGGAEAVFVATRAALRVMIPQASGSIVNVSSTNGLRAMPGLATYSTSKAAIIHFSAVAAIEAAHASVRVNAVAPGIIETPHTQDFLNDQEARAGVESKVPMLRSGRAEEIAAPIVFLLSDAATYITGACLPIDGGKAAQLFA